VQKDFTYYIYSGLIASLKKAGYVLLPFIDYISNGSDFDRCVVIRHDVDRKPGNALVIAKIEKDAGIKASYYFRMVKESYDENIIRQIMDMGHEIGYHYENLSEISKQKREIRKQNRENRNEERGKREKEFRDKLLELAIEKFELNLRRLRKLYPVKTICMHGSPLSKYDNKKMWEKYDYKDYGIIADPSFDIDYNEVFYITDTGRSWNKSIASIRDKVNRQTTEDGRQKTEFRGQRIVVGGQKTEVEKRRNGFENLRFHSTFDIIEAAEKGLLPDKMMINTHPQRWTDDPVEWTKELVWQNVKNMIKKFIVSRKVAKTQRRA
jgi:hypothetical protein